MTRPVNAPGQGHRSGYRDILDGVLDAVLAVDPRGRIVFANRAVESIFGYAPYEVVGRLVEVLVPPAARERHPQLRRGYSDHPQVRGMGSGAQLAGLRKDGSTFPAEVSLAPLSAPDGPLTIAVVRDVTLARRQQAMEADAVRLERALQASDERFRQAFDHAPIGMMLVSARSENAGRILRANEVLCRLVGVPEAQLLGRDALEFLQPEDAARADRERRQLLSGAVDWVRELERRITHIDGHQVWVEVTASLVRDEAGQPDYVFVSQVVDVTARRQARKEEQQRHERDRRIAAVLQDGLMPSVPTRIGSVEVATRYQPAGQGVTVGGDWHDAFMLANGRIGVTVGDVAGHGIESAAAMSRLRYAARMLATTGAGPAEVITRLNRIMHDHDTAGPDGDPLSDIQIATVVHAQLDPITGAMVYCSAGHLPLIAVPARGGPIPADRDQGSLVRSTWPLPALGGPPIGVIDDLVYTEHPVLLDRGGMLVGFTDGLIERRGASLDDGLRHLIQGLDALPASTFAHPDLLAGAVVDNAPAGPRTDDTALIVLALPRGRTAVPPRSRSAAPDRVSAGEG